MGVERKSIGLECMERVFCTFITKMIKLRWEGERGDKVRKNNDKGDDSILAKELVPSDRPMGNARRN